jgi:hypothetical protein
MQAPPLPGAVVAARATVAGYGTRWLCISSRALSVSIIIQAVLAGS